MIFIIKASLISFFAILVIGGGYVIGYIHGFGDRGASLREVAITVKALESIKEGRKSEGLEQLEGQIDSAIVRYLAMRDGFSPQRFLFGDPNAALMQNIAKYRNAVPSRAFDPKVREAIDAAVGLKRQAVTQ